MFSWKFAQTDFDSRISMKLINYIKVKLKYTRFEYTDISLPVTAFITLEKYLVSIKPCSFPGERITLFSDK
jgi:hypothetical protein